MKVIDLLNKIANGEELPKKIMYEDIEFGYSEFYRDYLELPISDKEHQGLFNEHYFDLTDMLNDEIEIIEEPKKIEKILIKTKATLNCIKDSETIHSGEYYVIHSDFIIALEEEIKEIIDYINKGDNND